MIRRHAVLRGLVLAALLLAASSVVPQSANARTISLASAGPSTHEVNSGSPDRATAVAPMRSPALQALDNSGNDTETNYTVEKIYYGQGWATDSGPGVRRLLALLNLTEGHVQSYLDGGTFSAFTQLLVDFSIPATADGSTEGPALQIRFSYYVDARCIGLNETTCPLGTNTTAVEQDVFNLEVRRILEYRDADANGSYDSGETVVREVLLAQPQAPFIRLQAFAGNGSQLDLPYLWNVTSDSVNLTQGALFAGDPLLDALSHFQISVGNVVPVNLTLDSLLFLKPTLYKGVPLTPSELKLDFSLEVPDYVANDTALALELGLTSDHFRLAVNRTGATEGVYASAGAAAAFFSWNANATLDGARSAAVGSTIAERNETSQTVYLAYPRATSILHDPLLGLALYRAQPSAPEGSAPPTHGSPPAEPTLWPWALAVVVTAVAVGAGTILLFWTRRRRS